MPKKHSRKLKFLFILALLVLATGCGTMKAKTGNTVKVDYLGTTEGKVFDTSIKEEAEKAGVYNDARDYAPLEFKVGAGQMIKGFDNAVLGMAVGEEKTVTLNPEEAYGSYNPELVKEVPLAALKAKDEMPKVGQRIQLMTNKGPLVGMVKEIKDTTIVLDFNPELAGKSLTFKIILRDVA